METPVVKKKPRAKPVITYGWCKKCGICVEFCPTDVFTADEFGKPVIAAEQKCTGCGLCVVRCPDFAIELEDLTDYEPEKQTETHDNSPENQNDEK